MEECFRERLIYYWRHGLYGHALVLCEEGVKQKSSNLILFVWHALSHGILGNTQVALQEMERVSKRPDLIVFYKVSLLFIHSCSKTIDESIVKGIRDELSILIESKNDFSMLNAAFVAWLFGDLELSEQILKHTTENNQSKAILGWILYSKKDVTKALDMFLQILSVPQNAYDLIPLYGKACCIAAQGRFSDCFQVHAQIISRYDFPEIHMEKARIHLSTKNWGLSYSIAKESLDKMISNLEFYVIETLYNVLQNDMLFQASEAISKIYEICEKVEYSNWKLLCSYALLFASISSSNPAVIENSSKIARLAVEKSNNESITQAVMGYHQLLAGNLVVSIPSLQKSLDFNPENVFASECLIKSLINTGRFSEAQDQIDIYNYVADTSIALLSLQAQLKRNILNATDSVDSLIEELLKHTNDPFNNPSFDFSVYPHEVATERVFNSIISSRFDIISDVLDEIVYYNRTLSQLPHEDRFLKVESLISSLQKIAPGYPPLKFARARLYYLNNKFDEAQLIFEKLILSKWIYRYSSCVFCLGLIHYFNKDYELSKGYLKDALELDSSLENNIEYCCVSEKMNCKEKKASFSSLMHLFQKTQSLSSCLFFIDQCFEIDEFSLPLELIKSLNNSLSHPYDKMQIAIRQSKILASKNQFSRAFSLLEKLKSHKKYYEKAIIAESEIKLVFQKDEPGFLQCFKDLLSKEDSPHNRELLGDAYAKIFNYDAAAEIYIGNGDLRKIEPSTILKLVMVLVRSHRFDKAATVFTQTASLLKGVSAISMQLIKLLIKLKRYKEAQLCINSSIRLISPQQAIPYSEMLEQRGIVLSRLHNHSEAEKCFSDAMSYLEPIVNAEKPNRYIFTLKTRISSLCVEAGKHCELSNQRDKAAEQYQKALQFDPSNCDAVISLFNLYKIRYDIEKCKRICSEYLLRYPKTESIILLLTSVENREYGDSIRYLEGVLNDHPHYYRSLVRLVEICARAGKLSIVRTRIDQSEFDDSPGMCFVRGLYNLYISKNEIAIKYLEKAALSNKWQISSYILIFRCLINPDKRFLWMENMPLSSESDLLKADSLLKKIRLEDNEKAVFQAELLASYNTPDMISRAASIIESINGKSQSDIHLFVAQARYYAALGKFKQASTLVEQILVSKPFHENYSVFEEAYLLKAHLMSVESTEHASNHYVFLALDLNMSCKKGWEMSAKLHLKNKNYNEAYSAFSRCWELSGNADLEAGYNAAFCAMNVFKPEVSLALCRKVLDINPLYKDMKERILVPSFKLLFETIKA